VGVVVGAALATSAWATPRAGHAATGVIVEGHRVTERDDLGAIVRDRATRWLDEEVWLEAGSTTERLRRAEIGYAIDVDASTRQILLIGRTGAWLEDLATLLRARAGREQVSLVSTLDAEAVRVAVASLAGRFDQPAVGAQLDEAGRLVSRAEAGRSIDVAASTPRVLEGLAAGERRFPLVVRVHAAPVDPARIARAHASTSSPAASSRATAPEATKVRAR
jgi:hypothetical protein